MKKILYPLAITIAFCCLSAAAETKSPQEEIGTAAKSTANDVGKGADQLAGDVSKGAGQMAQDAQKGTGKILNAVGKFLQDLGKNLSGASPQQPKQQEKQAAPGQP